MNELGKKKITQKKKINKIKNLFFFFCFTNFQNFKPLKKNHYGLWWEHNGQLKPHVTVL